MNHLVCEICKEPFDEIEKIPKILTCGHSFCSICLHEEDGKIIHCIRCGENSFQTKPNYDLLRCLKIASNSEHLNETLTPPDLPKPDSNRAVLQIPKCEFCEENNAYSYCQSCTKLKYLCDDCFSIRHKKSPLDEHTRVPWKAQYRNPICETHDQECLIFCKKDLIPICTLCSYGDHLGHESCLVETEILETESRIKKKLRELDNKTQQLRTTSLEANLIYTSLCGSSLLDSSKEQGLGTINQVTQEIHSHFYALRHMLQQKEEELVRLVKDKAQEKLTKLTQQIDDAAVFISKTYIFNRYIQQCLTEMPHYWVLENEEIILQHIQKLMNNEGNIPELVLHDHVVVTPEILFQSADTQHLLDSYRIKSSDDVLLLQPLSNHRSSNEYFIPDNEVSNKINDFLSDPIFSCSPEPVGDARSLSKYFTLAEEEPYICYPGVAKRLTIISINAQNEKIVVGGGGGEHFRCTLEKQEMSLSSRKSNPTTPPSSSKKLSSRRSITPPHFRHTSFTSSPSNAKSGSSASSRASTPPPSRVNHTKTTRSQSIPRTSSGSSLHSFGSHSTLSSPKKQTYESFTSLSPKQVIAFPSPESDEVNIHDNDDGTYTLTLLTQKQGLFRLNITLSGDHIRGSPYILHSEYHTEIIGSKGSACGFFSSPYGAYFDQDTQQLFVADSSNNKIQIFSSKGEFISSFGTHGRGNGQFSWPLGLCVCEKRIYVCDNMNNRVQIFDLNGTYLKSIGVLGKSNTQLLTPYDICCNGDLLFIADTGNKRIQIHSLNGDYVRSIAFKGKQRLFSGPIGVCCGDELLFVSDHNYNRILVFTLDGEYVQSIGTKGSKEGELYLPHGIAFYDGLLYVSDSGNNRIQIFSKEGNFIRVVGQKGLLPGQFSFPRAISIGNGFAYIADSNNHRIQYFPVES